MSQNFTSGPAFSGSSVSGAPLVSDDRLVAGVLSRRLVAWLVDVCLLMALGIVGWLVVGVLTLGLGLPLLSMLPLLYNWGFVSSRLQATPGQAMLGLAVVRDEDLGPPTLLQALVWTLGYLLTVFVFFPLTLVALFTTRHRALHDLASGLLVVRRRALAELA